jgi:hypothetical protein
MRIINLDLAQLCPFFLSQSSTVSFFALFENRLERIQILLIVGGFTNGRSHPTPGLLGQSLTFFDLCDRISDDSQTEFLTDFALENKDLTPLEIQFIAMALLHCG